VRERLGSAEGSKDWTDAFWRVTTRECGPILASTDPSQVGNFYWEFRWGVKDWTGHYNTSREASTAGRGEMAKARGLADRAGLVAHNKALKFRKDDRGII